MRWRGRRESSNVWDRRGEGGGSAINALAAILAGAPPAAPADQGNVLAERLDPEYADIGIGASSRGGMDAIFKRIMADRIAAPRHGRSRLPGEAIEAIERRRQGGFMEALEEYLRQMQEGQ